jgi:hypothetical protein
MDYYTKSDTVYDLVVTLLTDLQNATPVQLFHLALILPTH